MEHYYIFLFHRDLRLEDHNTLNFLSELCKKEKCVAIPMFIFTPEQVGDQAKIKSTNSIQFMIQCLMDLNKDLRKEHSRLLCYYGDTLEVLYSFIQTHNGCKGIVETKDYTPYAKRRESNIRKLCMLHDLEHYLIEDIYLINPGELLNASNKVFQKFTPFYEKAKQRTIAKPITKRVQWKHIKTILKDEVSLIEMRKKLVPKPNNFLHVKGGRSEGLYLLKHLPKSYDTSRDYPKYATSNLSAHNHFGTLSIREVYHKGKELHLTQFVRQLFWRDFYGHLMNVFEDLYKKDPLEFQGERSWKTDTNMFNKWKEGNTDHELVNAGMKQLNSTGYIHNRVRLVCASYLVKDLGLYWRLGEQYFANKLVDYDLTQNMMNWIWVSSLLPFASAPFRRLDPESQLKILDPKKEYVSKFIEA